ncbi:MAG: ATP-binding protein [bacterium]
MLTNSKILVIDDDPGIRNMYQLILSTAGSVSKGPLFFQGLNPFGKSHASYCYDITLAQSGEEGISKVKKSLEGRNPFAAAFVDLKMPGLNGAETVAWMWQIDPHIKIAIVTGYSDYLPEDFVMVAGRDDIFYLHKPFNPEEIRQFARAFCKQWSLEHRMEMLTQDLTKAQEDLEDMNKNLEKKVGEQTTMLIQSDKMASIGLLATGIAHEINNPIAFVNSNLAALKMFTNNMITLLKRFREIEGLKNEKKSAILHFIEDTCALWDKQKIDFIFNDIGKLIDESLEGTHRVSKIVKDLKSFARVNEEDVESVNLNEVIDATLTILRNELKYKTKIVKEYGELPHTSCFVQKMSQAFMNIITNAAQAIKENGTITIVTKHIRNNPRKPGEWIELHFKDNGVGIPKENLTKIFDPFFTTKPVGVGTGLGLKITYDIVKAHGGSITVESNEGEGTAFIIRLPVDSKSRHINENGILVE